jgi:hypothetical protein
MKKIRWLLFCLIVFSPFRAAFGFDLAAELAKAKPGTTVDVPAGTISGSFELPAGVTLRGAGYQKTTIDARGSQIGVRVKGSAGRIENLTILNAGTGIALSKIDDVTVSRVMILGGTIGIGATHVSKTTIENTVVARLRIECFIGNEHGVVQQHRRRRRNRNRRGWREQKAGNRLQPLCRPFDGQDRGAIATPVAADLARCLRRNGHP